MTPRKKPTIDMHVRLQVRTIAQTLDELASKLGGKGASKRKTDLLSRLRGLAAHFERLIVVDGSGEAAAGGAAGGGVAGGVAGPGQGAGAGAGNNVGRSLLAALNRVFAPAEAAVSRLVSLSRNAGNAEEDMLRSLFVVKIEAMQVVLVAAMRCPSAAAAQTLVPAMQARLELTAAEVAHGLLLPKLSAVLRPILERMVPPAVLAGSVARGGGREGVGDAGNSWALQRTAGGGAGEEIWGWGKLGLLRWALARHVESRRREARLGEESSELSMGK